MQSPTLCKLASQSSSVEVKQSALSQHNINELDSDLISENKDSSKSEQALSDLNEWILTQCSICGTGHGEKWFVRIRSGILIRYSALSEFIKEHSNYISTEKLIECLANYLRKEDDQHIVRYHFVYEQNEEVVRGIILLKKFLCEALKSLPAENQFIQNLSTTIHPEEV